MSFATELCLTFESKMWSVVLFAMLCYLSTGMYAESYSHHHVHNTFLKSDHGLAHAIPVGFAE